MTTSPKAIIIGVGNPFRSDDGAGPAILRLLECQIPPEIKCLEETGDGAELLDAWRGVE